MLTRQCEPWELTPGARMSLIFASAWRVHAQALPFSYFQVFIAPCVENSLPNCTRNTFQILTIFLEIHLYLKAQKMRLGPIYSSTTESHSGQMSQRSQVSEIGSQKCSVNVILNSDFKLLKLVKINVRHFCETGFWVEIKKWKPRKILSNSICHS